MEPFVTTKKGNKFILVLMDNITKFVLFYVVQDTRAVEILQEMQDYLGRFQTVVRVLLL